VAVHVLETAGGQEYTIEPTRVAARLEQAYGPGAAQEIMAHLPT
jgi:hypothetical protein